MGKLNKGKPNHPKPYVKKWATYSQEIEVPQNIQISLNGTRSSS